MRAALSRASQFGSPKLGPNSRRAHSTRAARPPPRVRRTACTACCIIRPTYSMRQAVCSSQFPAHSLWQSVADSCLQLLAVSPCRQSAATAHLRAASQFACPIGLTQRAKSNEQLAAGGTKPLEWQPVSRAASQPVSKAGKRDVQVGRER